MSNDPRMSDPPVDATFTRTDGTTWTRRERAGRNIRPTLRLRALKPLLRVTCSNVPRTSAAPVCAAVIEDANGLSLLTPGSPNPIILLLDLVMDLKTFPDSCPCGHMHTIDLGKLREAVAQLRGLNYKARTIDVLRVSP